METKIQKWGNSLGVRLPKAVIESQSLGAGSMVRVSADAERIIIEKIPRQSPTIQALVAAITDDNQHEVIDWGAPRGNEVW
jgi:antitoxin MazE